MKRLFNKKIQELLEKWTQSEAMDLIKDADTIDEFATKHNLRNKQWFINWQDELNRISVK